MKKNLFFVAAAALMLASCSNDVKLDENTVPVGSNQQNEISFFALSQRPNRKPAAAVEGTTFPAVAMMVTAYNATSGADFFGATAFNKDNETSTWKGSKYWPLSPATINFLAIANANADNATGVTWGTDEDEDETYDKFASQVQIVMSDNSSAQRDLMYACGTGTVIQAGNAITCPASVPMEFKHAQAWILFNVAAGDATSATAITINSITLNSVSCAGTYTVTHANWNETKAARDEDSDLNGSVSGAWTNVALGSNIAAAEEEDFALSTSSAKFADLMVVPDRGIASFTINYSVGGQAYDYTYTPASTTLAQATKYTYNITLTLHEIEVAPEVADWANGGSTAVAIPE